MTTITIASKNGKQTLTFRVSETSASIDGLSPMPREMAHALYEEKMQRGWRMVAVVES